MGSVKHLLFVLFLFFYVGCNNTETESIENECEQLSFAFDMSSHHLRKYQEMTYIELIHEVDSNRIEKLRVKFLQKLFNLRDSSIKELQDLESTEQLLEVYEKFVKRCTKLVPKSKEGRLIRYSEKIFQNQCKQCCKLSFVRLSIFLTIEEALLLNLEHINSTTATSTTCPEVSRKNPNNPVRYIGRTGAAGVCCTK